MPQSPSQLATVARIGSAEPSASAPISDAHRINFSWLLKLRWGAIIGQVATILAVDSWLRIALPLGPLAAIIAVEIVSNVACTLWARRGEAVDEWMLGGLMASDVLLLTSLLYFTGGQTNPFSFLYLIHLALAAIVLRAWWTWSLVGLSLACFGALFLGDSGLAAKWFAHPEEHAMHMRMHMQGMWIGFGIASAFIVYFLTRVTSDLAHREAELAGARAAAVRSEKLASLATLAAGAAHELATPLSTIAVVAKELEHGLERGVAATVADAQLIRQEVNRCRAILEQMASDAGASAGEGLDVVAVRGILDAALDALAERKRVRIEIDGLAESGKVLVPPRAVAQALRGVIKNALQASPKETEVVVRLTADALGFKFEVHDTGHGMPPEVLLRAGEPFFTTKEPGEGMGLGLFLTRIVLERIGGGIEVDSRPGAGTRVVLSLPAAEHRIASTASTKQS